MEEYFCCKNCGARIKRNPRLNDKIEQKYCNKSPCQRVRKTEWHITKIANDRDYKENQRNAEREWHKRHPDYYSEYRNKHPDYVRQNRELQRKRDKKRKAQEDFTTFTPEKNLATMDASASVSSLKSGNYRLIPLKTGHLATMDALFVHITLLSGG